MSGQHKQDEITSCSICNRPVLNHDIDLETGIAYCYGCHHYFPLSSKSQRSRDEIVIPRGTEYIRFRILRDELDISIKWSRNYQLWKAISSQSNSYPKLFHYLAALFNRTTIEVRSGYIKIDHGPIDILPMVFYSSRIITQFYVSSVGKEPWTSVEDSTLGLYVKLSSGQDELLIWDLKKTTLLFIEQEMERVLKIVDEQ